MFLQSIVSAASHVDSGTISQKWISSVYAASLALGASDSAASIFHISTFLLFVGVSLFLFRSDPNKRFWITTGMAVVFASPYLMYYDIVYLLFPLSLTVSGLDATMGKNWIYAVFLGEVGMVAVLGLETTAGFGFLIFLSFATAILFGKSRYSNIHSDTTAATVKRARI